MRKIFTIFFILTSLVVFSQDMTSYNEKKGSYSINYPSEWEVSENPDNYNQVSFYPEDEKIMASIIYGDLGNKLEAKYLLDATLKYLGVENLINEEDSYASKEELKKWNADSANAGAFNMSQDGVDYYCILIIMMKETYYYSVMFIINKVNVEENYTYTVVNNMLNSFKILK